MHSITSIRTRKSVSLMVASFAVVTVLLFLMILADNSARVQAQTPDGDAQLYENMDPLLYEIVQQYERGEFAASAAAASAPVSNGASVGVIFLTESGKANDISEFLVENGVTPGPAFDSFIGADVPVSLLASASQQDGVAWMEATIPRAWPRATRHRTLHRNTARMFGIRQGSGERV